MGDKSMLIDARRKNWFWDYNDIFVSDLSSNALLVRLYLAKCADNDTRQAWPSLNNIAIRCKISRATVKRAINELIEKGWLIKKVRKEDGVYTSNLYILRSPDERIEDKERGGRVTQTLPCNELTGSDVYQDRVTVNLPCNELTGVGSEGTYGRVTVNRGVGSQGAPNNTNILTIPNEQYFIKDRVTNDSLRSSLVTHAQQKSEQETDTEDINIEKLPVERELIIEQETAFTDAGVINKKSTVEKELNLTQDTLSTRTDGINNQMPVESESILEQGEISTETGVNNKKSTAERELNINQDTLSIGTGGINNMPVEKEPDLNQEISTIEVTPQITNADLITALGDSLREAWDGPPAKAYAVAGRMYYLYDYPAAEAAINIFSRRVEQGFKPKNPVAYLMKVAREKKKEFESQCEEPQLEELDYFSAKYPEEHKKRVMEAKKVSAEHEQYLRDFRDLLVNKSPPSIPGFTTPGESFN